MVRRVLGAMVLGMGLWMGAGTLWATTVLDALILQGNHCLSQEDYARAAHCFKQALQLDERNALAQNGLQQALWQEAEHDPYRAQTEVIQALYLTQQTEQAPWLKKEHYSLTTLANIAGSNDEKLYQKALLSIAQLQHGNPQGAFKTAVQLKKQYPEQSAAWNVMGMAWQGRGDSVQAKTAFQKALALNEDFHSARLNLAEVSMQGGDFKTAQDHINQVLAKTNAGHRGALLSMAKLKQLEGQPQVADEWYARAGESL